MEYHEVKEKEDIQKERQKHINSEFMAFSLNSNTL